MYRDRFLTHLYDACLAPQEFQMDEEIVEDLKQRRQDALDAVSKEMAWEEEKCRITLQKVESRFVELYSVSQKNHPCDLRFSDIFHIRLRILNQFFKHLLYVPIYARFQIFIQLSEILSKLCHIKRDYLVHIICSKCPP